MGRQTTQRVCRLAPELFAGGLCVWLTLAACQGVPSSANDAANSFPDAATADARIDAASPDAAIADAGVDAAVDAAVDASPNPHAIALEDVTSLLANTFQGGTKTPNAWGAGTGAAIGDIDGDGDLDIVIARCDEGTGGPTTLLLQAGATPSYSTLIENAGFAAQFVGTCAHGVALGDMDNDGDLDIFIALDGPDRLLRNEGAGTFIDVSIAAGVAGPSGDLTIGAVWADLNRDGLLDLYVVAHTVAVPPMANALSENRLYLNQADGTFRDVSVAATANNDGSGQVALVSDLDNDGVLEIYLANDHFAVNGKSKNPNVGPDAFLDPLSFDGEGVPLYVDSSAAYNTDGPRSSMGLALADLNEDGFDDIFVSDWGTNHMQLWNANLNRYDDLHQWWNLGFEENPLEIYYVSWGARFIDLDRDGSEELFVANGGVQPLINCPAFTQLNLLLRRVGGNDRFTDISAEVGMPADYNCPETSDIAISTRGVVVGDLDGDGDDDLLLTPFNEKYRFYRNNTPPGGHHWLRVRPVGKVSAPDPAGLVLEVELSGGKLLRRRFYAGGDTYSQSDRVVEVGLGSAASVVRATLHWPSGFSQRIDTLAGFTIDTELTITEPNWQTLSSRVVTGTDPIPTLTYVAVDETGAALGATGAGRTVSVSRSDAVGAIVTDNGDGTYTAALPHPGSARMTVLTLTVDGAVQNTRLSVNYK